MSEMTYSIGDQLEQTRFRFYEAKLEETSRKKIAEAP